MKKLLSLQPEERRSLKYLEDPDRELVELFGYPLPRLPRGDEEEGGHTRVYVEFFQSLGLLLREFFQEIHPLAIEGEPLGNRGDAGYRELREALVDGAVQALHQERRNGLYNLFFLALAKAISEAACEFFSQGGRKPYHKYLIHPLLASFLTGVHEAARRQVEELASGGVLLHLGSGFNDSLIQSILNDQMPLITLEDEAVHVREVLGIANPRFPVSLAAFKAIHQILSARIREGIERNDQDWLGDLQQAAQEPTPVDENKILRLLNSPRVIEFLLFDYETVGKRIVASRQIVGNGVPYSRTCRAVVDLAMALKRNEAIQLLKRRVEILSGGQAGRAEELYSEGRLYRYSLRGRIVNEARNITTVFLDLRGFTEQSEKAVSAGELTDQLYAIFDPITAIVREQNGRIDKFTGDGMMITFGVESLSQQDPLNALRMAVRVQESMRSLRAAGKTDFKMGVSIHSGMAVVAHFMAEDERVDRTVIGRNINIAGRLSSAGDVGSLEKERKEFEDLVASLSQSLQSEEERSRFLGSVASRTSVGKPISGVSIDARGKLYNLGIVLSEQTIEAIQKVVNLEFGEDGETAYRYYFDSVLSRQISLYYVGDVRFKGVESALPVYAVVI